MKSTPNTTAKKERWQQLHGKQKLQYFWDYYKFPAAVCLICLYIAGYIIHGRFSQKDIVLCTALVNVSASEELNTQISGGFTEFMNVDTSKNEVILYTGLYLASDQDNPNHEYTYASRIKIIASIDAEQLDVVLMDKEAFDAFSQNGYLCDLEELLHDSNPAILAELRTHLITNTVILEDNSEDLLADDSLSYQAVTDEYPMGLEISQKGLFQQARFEDSVYLGVIANSPRMDTAVEYIKYLYYFPSLSAAAHIGS